MKHLNLAGLLIIIAAVLLAKAERAVCLELARTDYSTPYRSFANQHNGITPKRVLRRSDVSDEERGFWDGIVSKLAPKIKGRASQPSQPVLDQMKVYETKAAEMMKLGQIQDTFASSNLYKLRNQIKLFNSKNSEIKVSLVGTLATKYGDGAVAMALAAAQKSAPSKSIADQFRALRSEQLKMWKSGGKPLDSVSTLLNFRKDLDLSDKFHLLNSYASLVKASDDALLRALIKGVGGEENIGAVLYAARRNPSTRSKASNWEDFLITKWASEGQLPNNVHQWLKLYDNVDDAFSADNLNKFMTYVKKFDEKYPRQQKPAIDLYTSAFGNTAVLTKLNVAAENPATRDVAKKLQAQQLKGWINSEKSVDDVLAKLKINRKEPSSIISQKIDVIEELVKVKGANPSVVKTLTETVGGKRMLAKILERTGATTLQKKQFASWMDDGVTPKDLMTKIYKKSAASASVEESKIADKFSAFYRSQKAGN